jgi:hypothetical protein
MAVSAFSKKDKIADQRYVVIESYLFTALGATGRGVYDRFFSRNTVNAYIKKASQNEPEHEREQNP